MSMNSSFLYGYGFPCECNDENFIDFLKQHKDTFCQSKSEKELYQEFLEQTKDKYNVDLDYLFSGYECESNGMEGLGAVIANIMYRETDIRFLYAPANDECETEASILFEQTMPWHLNDTERALTEEPMNDICQRYTKELGILSEPDYLSLEYFG